jgi:thiamine kinase-like enzyme
MPAKGLVFTHRDVRPGNIMVKADANNQFVVLGIINWETSGFYPKYFESTQVLYHPNSNIEND